MFLCTSFIVSQQCYTLVLSHTSSMAQLIAVLVCLFHGWSNTFGLDWNISIVQHWVKKPQHKIFKPGTQGGFKGFCGRIFLFFFLKKKKKKKKKTDSGQEVGPSAGVFVVKKRVFATRPLDISSHFKTKHDDFSNVTGLGAQYCDRRKWKISC